MKKLEFTINIKAPAQKVWQVLWNDSTYRQWTSAFYEGSYAVSDWKEGSKIQFLGPNGDGMFSLIESKVDNEKMIFKHLGEIKGGIEEKTQWDGAYEKYFLNESNGNTELIVELDATGEFEKYFQDTFPKALQIVKQISEK